MIFFVRLLKFGVFNFILYLISVAIEVSGKIKLKITKLSNLKLNRYRYSLYAQ